MKSWEITDSEIRITDEAIDNSAAKILPANTVLLVVRSGVLKHTAPVAINRRPVAVNQDMKSLECGPRLLPEYLARFLKASEQTILTWVRATTADNYPIEKIRALPIPLPPLDEQRRIAAILDHADALRRKRVQTLQKLAGISNAIFLEMFGDPAVNPRNWPLLRLGDTAEKFSDGPFGSNLKSEHYVPDGVRVIRLQNIGVNEFIDLDKAYISQSHFKELRKHECLPGDVLIGTLGDPNLRACIQPDTIPLALNKADCVQMRVDRRVCTPEFIVALLNLPSVERMAQSKILGQTRLRISMGRLRELECPVPPHREQLRFAEEIKAVNRISEFMRNHHRTLGCLFAALQEAAFSGQSEVTAAAANLASVRKLAAE